MYCGQTLGWIKMKLAMEVGLGPGNIVSDGDLVPLPQRGTASLQFSVHVCSGQTAGRTKTQTANRSVQPFLHSCLQKVSILCNRRLFPPKLLFLWGALDLHLIHDCLGQSESSQSKRHYDRYSCFRTCDLYCTTRL